MHQSIIDWRKIKPQRSCYCIHSLRWSVLLVQNMCFLFEIKFCEESNKPYTFGLALAKCWLTEFKSMYKISIQYLSDMQFYNWWFILLQCKCVIIIKMYIIYYSEVNRVDYEYWILLANSFLGDILYFTAVGTLEDTVSHAYSMKIWIDT